MGNGTKIEITNHHMPETFQQNGPLYQLGRSWWCGGGGTPTNVVASPTRGGARARAGGAEPTRGSAVAEAEALS